MKLNQLADPLGTKTIHLIEIARALKFDDLPHPHGGNALSPAQAQQITNVFRYMKDRQIAEPAAAIAQMSRSPGATDEIAVSLRVSVVDELRRRYPEGSTSDRILRLLGAVQAFEQMYTRCVQPQAIATPTQTIAQP